MKRNSILFVIALVAAMAMMGNASADPAGGEIASTVAQGQIVTLYLDVNPSDYVTVAANDGSGNDSYYFSSLAPLLNRNGFSISTTDPFNATIEVRCSGTERDINGASGSAYTNTLRNTTPTTAHIQGLYDGALDWASILELEPCPEPTYIDLNVSEISVNPSCKPGTLRANTTNEICAKIVNDGTAAAGEFNVSFVITGIPGGYSKEVTVTGGIPAGENRTVCITDYQPTSPGAVTINVTADCNLAVGESDEGNNSKEMSATVCNNGYMGKRLTGGEDINLVTKEEGRIDLKYAVCNATTYINATGEHDFGVDQTYLSGSTYPNWTEYRARWDKNPQLPIPSGETIKKATLYIYYTTSYYPDPDFNVSFNGNNYTMTDAVLRTDVKGWPPTSAYGNAPSGMLTYDVTSEFDNTTNTMVVYNLKEPGPDKVTLQGAVLAVVYEHGDEPERIIYINEGFDLLTSASYSCCTPGEATAYADFIVGSDPLANATLITISTGAVKPDKHSMFFNGEEFEGGLDTGTYPTDEGWSPPAVTSYMDITANETDVYQFLQQGSNTAKFQDYGDGFCIANAILKLEKREEVVVAIDPCAAKIGSDPSARTTVNISLNGIADYGSGTIHLHFDTTYVDIDSIGLGDSTNLHSNKVTDGHYTISASNSDGISGNVAFANVTFKPMGPTTGCSDLNLVVEKLYDRNFVLLDNVTTICEICIEESNIPGVTTPTASPTRILNDNGRDRVQLPVSTNLSNLSVYVTDDTEVDTVTIDLTLIRGAAGYEAVSMTLVSGTKQAGTWSVVTNATRDDGQYLPGINMTHCLAVNATDTHGNSNTANCVTLQVLRRGDIDPESVLIPQNNKADIGDYNEIARYTVGLRSMPDEFTAGTVPANSHNGVDMADALYIAMYEALNPHPGYPAP